MQIDQTDPGEDIYLHIAVACAYLSWIFCGKYTLFVIKSDSLSCATFPYWGMFFL